MTSPPDDESDLRAEAIQELAQALVDLDEFIAATRVLAPHGAADTYAWLRASARGFDNFHGSDAEKRTRLFAAAIVRLIQLGEGRS